MRYAHRSSKLTVHGIDKLKRTLGHIIIICDVSVDRVIAPWGSLMGTRARARACVRACVSACVWVCRGACALACMAR